MAKGQSTGGDYSGMAVDVKDYYPSIVVRVPYILPMASADNQVARGIHGQVPSSVIEGWWLFVLVCYLDDSGGDTQNAVSTLAGYVADEASWKRFEAEVEPIFREANVDVLHAKELEGTKGTFAGWTVLRKQAFVARISSILSNHALIGVSFSCAKDQYQKRAAESGRKKTKAIRKPLLETS